MRRARRVLLVAMLAAVLAACGSSDSSMLDAKGNEARHIAGAWWVMFGLAIGVYVIVAGFIIVAVARNRRQRRADGDGHGDDGGGSSRVDAAFVWIGGIVVPVLILAVVGVVTVDTTAALRKPDARALRVEVQGKDWWWGVHYPDSGITTANDLYLPVGRPIELRLTSDNVIHSFWVPQIGGKVDVIPGQPNYFRFTIEHAGLFRGQCTEFCGVQHANMAIYVRAEPPGLFDRWEAAHAQAPSEPTDELAAQGAVVFQRAACAGCHTVRGTQAVGTKGPDLTMIGSRHTIGAGTLENTAANLRKWITDPQRYKPGALMPAVQLSDDDRTKVVAYLLSLK
jgi:cytochrome c oxidase subunit 2